MDHCIITVQDRRGRLVAWVTHCVRRLACTRHAGRLFFIRIDLRSLLLTHEIDLLPPLHGCSQPISDLLSCSNTIGFLRAKSGVFFISYGYFSLRTTLRRADLELKWAYFSPHYLNGVTLVEKLGPPPFPLGLYFHQGPTKEKGGGPLVAF